MGNPRNIKSVPTAIPHPSVQLSSTSDLSRDIAAWRRTVECTPKNHPNKATYLMKFGLALLTQFNQTGSVDNINKAIATMEQAVALTPNYHSDHAIFLNNVGIALQSRFERTGSMDDLDRAITTNEQAVASTPDDHPDRAMYLNNLGNALQRRFERTGSMDDLDRAITTNEQAVASTPDDHPDRSAVLNNLGVALGSRFERTGSMDDLDRAITTKEQAVASTPDDHPSRAMYLNNLGSALQSRFERTGSMDDLDWAITTNEQAVASTPHDHPHRSTVLNSLESALRSRFERTGSINDLDRAITTNEQAVASTPDDHPSRAMYLHNLGLALRRRFERTGSMDDLDRAITTMEQAVAIDTAPPSIRLKAARSCSDILVSQNGYNRAKAILKTAVKLLPTLSPRTLKHGDRQYNISHFSDITPRAVSLAIIDGEDPYECLQLSELGRGILANLQLEVRSDISVLAALHSDIAQQFQTLRDQIDTPSASIHYPDTFDSSTALDSSVAITERRTLLSKFDGLLRFIRSLDGFENFLRGPSRSELHSLADRGPIVVFNVSDIRSDAFLITTNEICSLLLPLLTSDSLKDFAKRFFRAIYNQDINRYRHAKHDLSAVLE